ncbi:hypothetical protein NE236_32480 [Actinoallomurus purpureus]|uniref:hypothetical protein n=1 Tax=Actinoallomurus purpureus TaxID=478114 RepID=UPI0020924F5C|nr:hypothetical protein [Actinoallomurus purpureus]MCO6009698.1 hypothetical protein [Actinoallomurus purpureus]
MSDETIGDGAFQGIVMPCQMCIGSGELVTLQKDPALLRRGDCPQCDGTGHIRIRCTRDEVDEVIRSLPPSRLLTAIRQALTGVGLCPVCFGCGVLASIEWNEDQIPVRYLEASCPACEDRMGL